MNPFAAFVFSMSAWLLLTVLLGGNCCGDAPAIAGEVKAADLCTGRATIIGFLGHRLGEVVTIRGAWRAPPKTAKSSDPIFQVTHIDGRPVTSPLELTRYRVRAASQQGRSGQDDKERWDWLSSFGGKASPPDFKPGEAWELSGVETFSTQVPVNVWDESGTPVAVSPDYGAYGFLATFDFIRARRIATQQGETPK